MKKFFYGVILILTCNLYVSNCIAQAIQGTYAIKNVQTGMLLRIKDANKTNGTPLVSYSPVNWKCVTWDFKHVEGQTYQLKNLFTGKTFQSVNTETAEGVALQQQPLVLNQDNQEYEFIPAEMERYFIKLKGTDLYVTPADPAGTENTGIVLSKKNGNSKIQQWTIYEQKPTM